MYTQFRKIVHFFWYWELFTTSHMLGRHCATELYPQPSVMFFPTDGVTFMGGTLVDVMYHRKATILLVFREELESAHAAISKTKQQFTVPINLAL